MPSRSDRQHLVVERGERRLHIGPHHRLAEQAHQVVGQHGKAQRSLGGVEIVQVETVQPKVSLEFLDAVFAVGTSAVDAPDFNDGKRQRRHHCPIAPALKSGSSANRDSVLPGAFLR